MIRIGRLRFSVAVDVIIVVGFELVGVGLVDFGVMVLELDSSFGGCFCLELGGVKEWTFGEVVREITDVHAFDIFVDVDLEYFFHNF